MNENDALKLKTKIYIKNYSLQDYTIYAGSALRSLEGEVTAKFQLGIENSEKAQDKSIEIAKRYKSNELNPFSEKEMIKKVQESIYKEILDEIIREVSFSLKCESLALNKYLDKSPNVFFLYGSEVVLRNNSKDILRKYLHTKGFS